MLLIGIVLTFSNYEIILDKMNKNLEETKIEITVTL
jgi:hypothetical protein